MDDACAQLGVHEKKCPLLKEKPAPSTYRRRVLKLKEDEIERDRNAVMNLKRLARLTVEDRLKELGDPFPPKRFL